MDLALKSCHALVLNADYRPLSYFPLSLWPWQETVKAVCLDRVDIVSEYEREVRSPGFAMRLPSVSQGRFYVESGGLMAIGGNAAEVYRLLAFCLAQVLKGTPPRDIPVMQPTQFDLFLNLATAKTLGLSVPPALVQRADEVIE